LLEYFDKIISLDIISINTSKELFNFSKNYGDVSFLLIDRDDQQASYECLTLIAKEYKPLFYFGFMPLAKYKNNFNASVPAILVKHLVI
jgi:hypothetical protein